jgi:hypothetical protein
MSFLSLFVSPYSDTLIPTLPSSVQGENGQLPLSQHKILALQPTKPQRAHQCLVLAQAAGIP